MQLEQSEKSVSGRMCVPALRITLAALEGERELRRPQGQLLDSLQTRLKENASAQVHLQKQLTAAHQTVAALQAKQEAMIADKNSLEQQIKDIQAKLMADVSQSPASPASVAHRIADQCTAALELTPQQKEQMIHILNTLNYAADAPMPELPEPTRPPPPDFSQHATLGAPPLPPATMIMALARADAPAQHQQASGQLVSADTHHNAQPPDDLMGIQPTMVDTVPATQPAPLTADNLQAMLPQPEQTPPPPLERASDAGTRRSNPY
eukprot:3359604-Amphidinium_carterae.1